MTYHPPLPAMEFAARLVGQDRLAGTDLFAEAGADTRAAVLGEAARLAAEVIAPLDAVGDRQGTRLENGVARTPDGFAAGFRALADGGWIGVSADPAHGGMGLPQSVAFMVQEMLSGACMSLENCLLLTQGQIEAVEAHGDDRLKALILPRLVSGEWTGTMNLSEPQAGSDVGAVATRAEPAGDGTYRLTGQKIWITWGDHDLAGNIVHLVLARLPDAPRGTKGISLFAVPKRWPEDGAPNGVRTVGLEEKLGLHASPTCVLAYEGARGWLVGAPHGGMAAMFTMMNNARLGVGIQGVGLAGKALQTAAAYARERVQGHTADGSRCIVGHADVRRMLMTMQAETEGARALAYDCALSIDLSRAAGSQKDRAAHAARAAVLTPIAKAWGTETGIAVADLGIQLHGGVGDVEQTGAARIWRDARVTSIYEGTNGIQALDLAGRKLSMDGGAAVRALIDEAGETAAALSAAGEAGPAARLETAVAAAHRVTGWMLEAGQTDRAAGATPYLGLLARLRAAHHLARAGMADAARRPLAAFYAHQRLPLALAAAEAAMQGAEPLYALAAEGFG